MWKHKTPNGVLKYMDGVSFSIIPSLYGNVLQISTAVEKYRNNNNYCESERNWNEEWQQLIHKQRNEESETSMKQLCKEFETRCEKRCELVGDSISGSSGACLPLVPGIYFSAGIVTVPICTPERISLFGTLNATHKLVSKELTALSEILGILPHLTSHISLPLACSVIYRGMTFWCYALFPVAGLVKNRVKSEMGNYDKYKVRFPKDTILFNLNEKGLEVYCNPNEYTTLREIGSHFGLCEIEALQFAALPYIQFPLSLNMLWVLNDNRTYIYDVGRFLTAMCRDYKEVDRHRSLNLQTYRPDMIRDITNHSWVPELVGPYSVEYWGVVNLSSQLHKVLLLNRLKSSYTSVASHDLHSHFLCLSDIYNFPVLSHKSMMDLTVRAFKCLLNVPFNPNTGSRQVLPRCAATEMSLLVRNDQNQYWNNMIVPILKEKYGMSFEKPSCTSTRIASSLERDFISEFIGVTEKDINLDLLRAVVQSINMTFHFSYSSRRRVVEIIEHPYGTKGIRLPLFSSYKKTISDVLSQIDKRGVSSPGSIVSYYRLTKMLRERGRIGECPYYSGICSSIPVERLGDRPDALVCEFISSHDPTACKTYLTKTHLNTNYETIVMRTLARSTHISDIERYELYSRLLSIFMKTKDRTLLSIVREFALAQIALLEKTTCTRCGTNAVTVGCSVCKEKDVISSKSAHFKRIQCDVKKIISACGAFQVGSVPMIPTPSIGKMNEKTTKAGEATTDQPASRRGTLRSSSCTSRVDRKQSSKSASPPSSPKRIGGNSGVLRNLNLVLKGPSPPTTVSTSGMSRTRKVKAADPQQPTEQIIPWLPDAIPLCDSCDSKLHEGIENKSSSVIHQPDSLTTNIISLLKDYVYLAKTSHLSGADDVGILTATLHLGKLTNDASLVQCALKDCNEQTEESFTWKVLLVTMKFNGSTLEKDCFFEILSGLVEQASISDSLPQWIFIKIEELLNLFDKSIHKTDVIWLQNCCHVFGQETPKTNVNNNDAVFIKVNTYPLTPELDPCTIRVLLNLGSYFYRLFSAKDRDTLHQTLGLSAIYAAVNCLVPAFLLCVDPDCERKYSTSDQIGVLQDVVIDYLRPATHYLSSSSNSRDVITASLIVRTVSQQITDLDWSPRKPLKHQQRRPKQPTVNSTEKKSEERLLRYKYNLHTKDPYGGCERDVYALKLKEMLTSLKCTSKSGNDQLE